nr:hypothetical protein [Candidatus Sigynarchaeota archaeon]
MADNEEILRNTFGKWGTVFDVDGFIFHVTSEFQKHEMYPDNSRLVFSVCPDDINRLTTRKTIENALVKEYNGDFYLGSLAGYPACGITGAVAASHHAPEALVGSEMKEGNLIFFVSAHLGMVTDKEVIFGKVLRPGQNKPSNSCGAMCGFLKALTDGKIFPGKTIEEDDEDDDVKQLLFNKLLTEYEKELAEIKAMDTENKKLVRLAQVNLALNMKHVESIVKRLKTKHHFEGAIGIIGGITINTQRQDYFVLHDTLFFKRD